MYAFTVSTETLPMVAMNFPLVQREGRRFFMAGTALQGADKVVDPDARVHVKEEVHMVRHDLHLKDAPAKGLRDLGEDLLKARVDAVHEHLPAILRAEDDMVAAAVYDMFTVMVLGFR